MRVGRQSVPERVEDETVATRSQSTANLCGLPLPVLASKMRPLPYVSHSGGGCSPNGTPLATKKTRGSRSQETESRAGSPWPGPAPLRLSDPCGQSSALSRDVLLRDGVPSDAVSGSGVPDPDPDHAGHGYGSARAPSAGAHGLTNERASGERDAAPARQDACRPQRRAQAHQVTAFGDASGFCQL